MSSVSLLIAYAPAGPERDAAWAWNDLRWGWLLPAAEIATGVPDAAADPGRFNRGQAVNRAAARAHGDIYVIADADTTYTPADLGEALSVAEEGGWTLPARYVRLDADASREWIQAGPAAGPPANWETRIEQELENSRSGIVVIPREAFEIAGGFDERFAGWGGDDDGFACAAHTLYAPPVRVGTTFHLWHPRPLEHIRGQPNWPQQAILADRYVEALGDPNAIRELISERAGA